MNSRQKMLNCQAEHYLWHSLKIPKKGLGVDICWVLCPVKQSINLPVFAQPTGETGHLLVRIRRIRKLANNLATGSSNSRPAKQIEYRQRNSRNSPFPSNGADDLPAIRPSRRQR